VSVPVSDGLVLVLGKVADIVEADSSRTPAPPHAVTNNAQSIPTRPLVQAMRPNMVHRLRTDASTTRHRALDPSSWHEPSSRHARAGVRPTSSRGPRWPRPGQTGGAFRPGPCPAPPFSRGRFR